MQIRTRDPERQDAWGDGLGRCIDRGADIDWDPGDFGGYGVGNPRHRVSGKVPSLVNRWTGWTAVHQYVCTMNRNIAGDPGHFG